MWKSSVHFIVAADVVKFYLPCFQPKDHYHAEGKGDADCMKSFEFTLERVEPEMWLEWVHLQIMQHASQTVAKLGMATNKATGAPGETT